MTIRTKSVIIAEKKIGTVSLDTEFKKNTSHKHEDENYLPTTNLFENVACKLRKT